MKSAFEQRAFFPKMLFTTLWQLCRSSPLIRHMLARFATLGRLHQSQVGLVKVPYG